MTTLRLHQINDVKLIGRLTRDPELRFTSKGQAVCRFDLAVNRRYKDASGEWKDDTTYAPIVVWRETAQRCSDRLKKGSPVYVEGRLKSRSWETKNGEKRTGLEVVAQRVQFLAKVEGEPEGGETEHAEASAETEGAVSSTVAPSTPTVSNGMSEEEEIPF